MCNITVPFHEVRSNNQGENGHKNILYNLILEWKITGFTETFK